ncbi:MAG: tRNA (N6-isopentenyl adenosine(37)-C2)-methylthiotransferase MiaB [Armatimonadetes bacterium]|nr:MAG: tRNA (N6-isopentenyl adenosine(37)-C2)-methylthiotransferase MiaB [Armatimonadota bacterium]
MNPASSTLPTPRHTASGGYRVVTWGCQMNVEDSEQMERFLQDLGLRRVERDEEADVILLNTCSVRKKPEDKAFSYLGELRKLKEQKPSLVIGVCGCMAQLRHEEIRRRCPHVDFIIGTAQVAQIPALVREARQKRRFLLRMDLPPRKGAIVTDVPQRHLGQPGAVKLKAFVPIQYGCDKFCTFCIVPTTRGRERSRSTQDILEEIRALAERGTKEITLLGQTVNSYGKNLLEGKVPFAKLLLAIAEIPGIERIRYTSPYPRDYRDDLIRVHRECPKVMPHVHLPLQSGNDKVLKEMRRLYTVDEFKAVYWRLREEVPDIAITTDLIVGFPGETEEEFQDTLKVVEELRFDSAFMFAYSPRPGTKAADREDQIPKATKRRRLGELIELQNRITCEINAEQVGRTYEVMVEGPAERQPVGAQLWKGLTRQGKTVHFEGGVSPGDMISVTTVESHLWGFLGRIVS